MKADNVVTLQKTSGEIMDIIDHLQLEDCSTVRKLYDCFMLLWDDLKNCGQPKSTDKFKVYNLICGLRDSIVQYSKILTRMLKSNDIMSFIRCLEE